MATLNDMLSKRVAVILTLGVALCGSAFAEDADWTGEPDYFVSYIESTDGGSQWIDLGVNAASPIKAEMKMMWNTVPGDGTFIGARIENGNRIYLAHSANAHWGYGYGSWCQVGTAFLSSPVAGTVYTVATEFRNGRQTMSVGDETSSAKTAADYDVGLNLYLFACNRGGTPDYFSHSRLYSLSVWQGDELKHVYSPCVKNGEACLYDKTTGDYFRNGGTAPLVAGQRINVVTLDARGGTGGTPSVGVVEGESMPPVTVPVLDGFRFLGYFDDPEAGVRYYSANGTGKRSWDRSTDATLYAHWRSGTDPLPLPEGYTAVDYIASTAGGGQYIDTEYMHKANTRIECEVEVSADQPTGRRAVFGARKNHYGSNAFCFFSQDSNNHLRYNRSGNEADAGSAFPKAQKVALCCAGDTAEWSVTGSGVTNSLTTTGTCDDGANTMFIFNLNTASEGGKQADTSPCDMKLYSFRIYEGETLVREFVPCIDGNLEIGLYEMQEGVFHANKGAGVFVCSPDFGATVVIPAHTSGVWTSGDGSQTNRIEKGVIRLLRDTDGVTLLLSAECPYGFLDRAETKTVNLGKVSADIASDDPKFDECRVTLLPIEYIDANGVERTCVSYEPVTAETSVLTSGWYVVSGTVSRGCIDVDSEQEAHLILMDGASLTVQGLTPRAGIDVSVGESLNIYGQRGNTGVLSAKADYSGAGIGGGYYRAGGRVTINGGTVTATGGFPGGAGIGGSNNADGGTVVINGGTVLAKGGNNGDFGDAAGIGGGFSCRTGLIAVGNGAVNSIGGFAGTVRLSGGIFAEPVDDAICAPGYGVWPNSDEETRFVYPYSVLPTAKVTVEVAAGVTACWTSGDGGMTNTVDGMVFRVLRDTPDVKVFFKIDPAYDHVSGEQFFDLGTVSEDRSVSGPQTVHREIEYIGADGAVRTNNSFAVVTEDISILYGGWYLVEGTLCRDGGIEIAADGVVNLILADGASLTVEQNGRKLPGIDVGAGRTLNVYGQVNGTGCLTVSGGYYGAGIGGGYCCAGGTVAIYGGTVTARGGWGGAGIGGGYTGDGGVLEILKGAVDAAGGDYAKALGRGGKISESARVDDGTVLISGGVFAMPVEEAWCAPGCAVWPNPDEATSDDYPYIVLHAAKVTVSEMPVGVSGYWTSGDGSETNAIADAQFKVPVNTSNVKVIFKVDPAYTRISGESVLDLGTLTQDTPVVCDLELKHREVEYVDENGDIRTNRTFAVVTADTSVMTGGWYVAEGTVTRSSGIGVAAGQEVCLILADGASLNVTEERVELPGIRVDAGTSLSIYGQRGGTGSLTATGASHGAGLGASSRCDCGMVKIVGGTVTATGGDYGAGIGGGCYSAGGSVAILGGAVAAFGAEWTEDIGTGYYKKGDVSVSISGGVFANPLKDTWLAAGCGVRANWDVGTRADYPYAVAPFVTVKVDVPTGATAFWTCEDGARTNAIDGAGFQIPSGTENVKVIFRVDSDYVYVSGDLVGELGVVVGDRTVAGPKIIYHEVEYVDADGVVRVVDRFTLVRNAETSVLTGGWYVVADDVSGRSIEVAPQQDVHLILLDDASLTVRPPANSVGVKVGAGESLCIYGQRSGTGILDVEGSDDVVGIGSADNDISGRLVINGGDIRVTGRAHAAAIGGCAVTVNGGMVTADALGDGPGIGASALHACGPVTINGGVVTATGGRYAAGIGTGEDGLACGPVAISGGAVSATGGGGGAEDIGSGKHASAGDWRVSVTVTGGVYARPVKDEWIPSGYVAVDNLDEETHDAYPYRVCRLVTVTVADMPPGVSVSWTSGDGGETNAVEGLSFEVPMGQPDVKVLFSVNTRMYDYVSGELTQDLQPVTTDRTVVCSVRVVAKQGIEYVGADGEVWFAEAYSLVTAETSEFVGGWYAVTGKVSCAGIDIASGQEVHLILADGASLTSNGADIYHAGIGVPAGAALHIYAQRGGTGSLSATGGGYGAGIGSCGEGTTSGMLVVNGGRVTATGGYLDSAGIGGGYYGHCGTVVINGGTVDARGKDHGAGIGGGQSGSGGTVTVNGGVVIATGGSIYSSGIGGGIFGDGGTLVVNGGTVTATGGRHGAGIGGGTYGRGGSVTINGGTVTATGGYQGKDYYYQFGLGGAGIGGGQEGDGGTVVINGGKVTATGGHDGAGIGGGYKGAGGAVTINGGVVTASSAGGGAGIGGGLDNTEHGTVTFSPDYSGGVFAGATEAGMAYMLKTAYENDHGAAYVSICKNARSVLSEAFDVGNSATVVRPAYDGSEIVGHEVILGTNYPNGVTLPTDVGAVTISLNGWMIRGAKGDAGTAATAGGDGGGAVTVAGESGVGAEGTTVAVKAVSSDFAAGTSLGVTSAIGDVMIVNLERDSEGHFPVTFHRGVDMGIFNCDVYKTTKIVLRRIPKGIDYPVKAGATSYPITDTLVPRRDFYMGLFEITGAQYDRVTNAESTSTDMHPKRYSNYSVFRSPTGKTQLDPPAADSFVGIVLENAVDASGRRVTGFDLPTANQWEIAARAGSTGEFGAYLDENGVLVDGSAENCSAFAQTGSDQVVGSLRPNAWGLYDMSGGVGEWCLNSDSDVETAVTGSFWPIRGNDVASWNIGHILSRYSTWSGYSGVNCGARLSCTLDVPESVWNGIVGGDGGDGHPPAAGACPFVDAVGDPIAVDDPYGLCSVGATGGVIVMVPTFAGWSCVLSNLTEGVELEGKRVVAEETEYILPLGAKVGIYGVPMTGFVIVDGEPYIVDPVTADLVLDADKLRRVMTTEPIHYTVTYSPGDGLGEDYLQECVYDVAVTAPSSDEVGMSRPHYRLVAWERADGERYAVGVPLVGLTSVEGGNVVLRAVWDRCDFLITVTNLPEHVSVGVMVDGRPVEKTEDGWCVVDGGTATVTFTALDGYMFVLDPVSDMYSVEVAVVGRGQAAVSCPSLIPPGYKLLESIRSTGTQYIDTEYIHKANTRIECEVEVAADQPTGWRAIFGARKTSYHSNAFCFFSQDNNNHIRYNRSGNEADAGSVFPRGQKVALCCAGDTAEWSVLGSGVTNSLTTTGMCDGGVNTMFIFNLNTAASEGGKRADTSPSVMRLYSFAIFEGNAKKHDFVPCLNADGRAGLYDLVGQRFFGSSGEDEFVAGTGCEGGTIAWSAELGSWIVTPTNGVRTVTITGLLPGDAVAVPPSVVQVNGVADSQIKVVSAGTDEEGAEVAYDITDAFIITGGAIALDAAGEVTIRGETISVRPIICDLKTEPGSAESGRVVATVLTIPGLVYELKRGASVADVLDETRRVSVARITAATMRQTMDDVKAPLSRAFYVVVVKCP